MPTQLGSKDLYAKRADESSNLLGFQTGDDYDRRPDRNNNREQRPKKGGKPKLTASDFPSL